MLTVDTIPLRVFQIADCKSRIDLVSKASISQSAKSNPKSLLGLFVISVLTATATELTKLKPIWRGLLILSRNVVAVLAVLTLQHNVISRHKSNP